MIQLTQAEAGIVAQAQYQIDRSLNSGVINAALQETNLSYNETIMVKNEACVRAFLMMYGQTLSPADNEMLRFALAKLHYNIEQSGVEPLLVIKDIPPTIPNKGSLDILIRLYRNRYGRFSGSWYNRRNEYVVSLLTMISDRSYAIVPKVLLVDLIDSIARQRSLPRKGQPTCLCGLRMTSQTCFVCGTPPTEG